MVPYCGQTVKKILYASKEHIYCLFIFEKFSFNLLDTYGEGEYILLLQIFHNTFLIINFIYFAIFLIPKGKTMSVLTVNFYPSRVIFCTVSKGFSPVVLW